MHIYQVSVVFHNYLCIVSAEILMTGIRALEGGERLRYMEREMVLWEEKQNIQLKNNEEGKIERIGVRARKMEKSKDVQVPIVNVLQQQ